jgi:hypothetical protein
MVNTEAMECVPVHRDLETLELTFRRKD